jgi:uncharacterized membrane protein (GlpM family)
VSVFLYKLGLSFVIGGCWIALVTLIAERFGSKVGGLIGGIPSTVVVAFFFIGWTQGPDQVFEATTVFPLAFSINSWFFLVYVLFARRSLALGLLGAVATWFSLQSVLILLEFDDFLLSVILWALILASSFVLLNNVLRIGSRKKVDVHYRPHQLILRAMFAGAMIAFAVVMSKVGGPILGGIFTTFPANNISTLVITATVVDVQFSRSIVTPLMVSAGINCVVFVVALRYTIQAFDLLPAALMALVFSWVSAAMVSIFISPRLA